MARTNDPKIVEEFPPQGRTSDYPWDEWTDGKIRELVRGQHFKGAVKTMRQTATKHAQKANKSFKSRAVTKEGKELLYIQFLPKG